MNKQTLTSLRKRQQQTDVSSSSVRAAGVAVLHSFRIFPLTDEEEWNSFILVECSVNEDLKRADEDTAVFWRDRRTLQQLLCCVSL